MMKTYKTYQECKIENPNCEVYHLKDKGLFTCCTHHKSWVVRFVELDSDGFKCDPGDHCMSVKEFLDGGYRFVEGDLIFSTTCSDRVVLVTNEKTDRATYSVSMANADSPSDNERYILRAAALESMPLKQYAVLYKGGSYSFQSDKPVGDDIVACFDLSHSEAPLVGDFFEEKPRTKVEYVKVTDSIWHLESDFKAGDLFAFDGESDYVQVETEGDFTISHSADNLFCRIETPMTWQDEIEEKYDAVKMPRGESCDVYIGKVWGDDAFVEFCADVAIAAGFKLVN